jgi:hypothetical protein
VRGFSLIVLRLSSMQRLSLLGARRLSTAAVAAEPASLRISEIFASIQGEGRKSRYCLLL